MRIRSVKPSFWTDATMAGLSIGARLTYIGLWNLADDDGWMPWSIREMGATIYPYESPGRRERNLLKWTKELYEAERIRPLVCGHAYIPTFSDHQHLSGRRTTTHHDRHNAECPEHSAESGDNPQTSAADRMG